MSFPLDRKSTEWQEWLHTVKKFMIDGELCHLLVKKNNDNRPYISIDILSLQFTGLLDSGANRTVISSSFARILKSLGLKSYKPKKVRVSTADGTAHVITDMFDVPVRFDNQFHVVSMLVLPNLLQNLILGRDFFDLFDITFHFKGTECISDINEMISHQTSVISRNDLNENQQKDLSVLIEEMKQTVGTGLGRTKILKHTIETGDSKPIYQKQYNFSPIIRKEIERELDDMIEKDVVETSYSAWCSPVLIVKKPNGDNRLCLDSRQLNKVTKRDTYPLPRVSSILDNLRNARYLTTIDLKSAFWQIELDDCSKEKTAFAVPGRGLFHFKVMPFGLVNASQSQQRLMDILFHSLDGKVWAYLDDIVVCSENFEEHLSILKQVILILKDANLTVNIDKCKFARPSLRFLGFIVDKEGLRTDPDKVSAILNYPRPKTITELKRFIGIASWYRRFVKDFSMIAAPLHNLTKGKRHKHFNWSEEAEKAFIELKTLLTTTPVMSCPDFTKPFTVQCDASSKGIGAVLSQNMNGSDQAVAYLSRKLNDREKQYSTSERELLSVVYAVEKFRPYLDGVHFTIVTDHSALQWLHKMKDPHGRLARWAMKLQQFDFDIIHKPGKLNTVPDALSRSVNVIKEINLIEILDKHKDSWYKHKIENILSKQEVSENWTVQKGLLFKKIFLKQYPNNENLWKLYVPESLRTAVLKECHDETTAGHFGIRKTLYRIKQSYYWPNIIEDVKSYVKNCELCAKFKVSHKLPFGLMGSHREVTLPWQIIAIDLMGPFPKSKKCNTMLLVITCLFSKFTLLFPLRTGKADKICEILESQFLLFGSPQKIICDNGKQFDSHIFKELANKFNTKIWYTPNYHPQGNPTERVNRVVGTMIATFLKSKNHNEWDLHLQELGHAIRTAVHETTGFTPSYLFLGRETFISRPNYNLNFPCVTLDSTDPTNININEFLTNLKEKQVVYQHVNEKLRLAHENSCKTYNLKRRPVSFEVGDVIWKRTKFLSKASSKFMAKLAPKFEKAIITKKISSNVFRLNNVYGKNIGVWHAKDIKAC